MEVMGPGAKFITMLRDPVDVFESAYIYYRMFVKYNLTLGRLYVGLSDDTNTEDETSCQAIRVNFLNFCF